MPDRDPENQLRELELKRRLEREKADLEVEKNYGPRPLEGLAGGHTTWTGDQDDEAARTVHASDEERSVKLSEDQAAGHSQDPDEDE